MGLRRVFFRNVTFLIVWPDHREHMRTPEFKEEFDQVIEALRSDRYEGILRTDLGQ